MIRCYDCGRELTADEAVRRDVVVSRGSSGGVLGRHYEPVIIGTSQVARVDLCPECDRLRAGREARRGAADARVLLTLLLVLAFIFLVPLLIGGVAVVVVLLGSPK